jgi:hypothetical protein
MMMGKERVREEAGNYPLSDFVTYLRMAMDDDYGQQPLHPAGYPAVPARNSFPHE